MRQHDIGNGVIDYIPRASAAGALSAYGGRLRVLKQFIHDTGCFWPTLTALARKIVDFDCPGDGVIRSQIEQEPNPDSRVSLTDDVDSFGLRRIQMNWQLSDGDLKTIRVLSIESAKEMARLNRARVQLAPFILDTNLEIPVSGYGHHMGTTRMSADPRYGVVDENCRVHGIQNLYIAGSSVFPEVRRQEPDTDRRAACPATVRLFEQAELKLCDPRSSNYRLAVRPMIIRWGCKRRRRGSPTE